MKNTEFVWLLINEEQVVVANHVLQLSSSYYILD